MASSRATTSAVSLDNWESLAPLNETAKASIAMVAEASSEKPLPARLLKNTRALQTATNTRPGTPSGSTTNLLRRAASRADLGSSRIAGSADSSVPGTPRPRSPSRANVYFSPPGTSHHQGQGHARMHSATSALALQLHPRTMSSPSTYLNGNAGAGRDPLEVHSPIETPQQFLDWFSGVEASMESDQEEVFRKYEMEIDAYIASCDEAMEMLEDSRGLIKEMEANYRFVEDNSKALQLACEAMLEEQKHLIEVTEAIDARLEYFKELETATRALSQPGDKVVLQEDFLSMVHRLDACLDFLKTKRNYRDSEVYIIRFQQCLTRAMTLIKMHFLQLLNSVYAEVASKLSGNFSGGAASKSSGGVSGVNLSETALNALLYAKFTTLSTSTKVFIVELERKALKNPDEYGSLLSECINAWTGVRRQLLGPSIAEEVRRMDPASSDLVKLARSGCAYLRNVCMNEWAMFREFFAYSGQEEVYRYLESMCDYLYDSLRPRILHEPKLEVLCELCNVLQALISLDGDEGDDEDTEDQQTGETGKRITRQGDITMTEDSFDLTIAESSMAQRANLSSSNGLDEEDAVLSSRGSLRFSELLSTVLQDTQTRLVFRAQYVIEAEVLQYVPKPEDLDYPGKLQRKRKAAAASKGKGREATPTLSLSQWQREHGGYNAMGVVEEDGVVEFKLPPEEIMEDWYPTLRKTLWILSKLHSYVNSAIFEDFAGEAVNLCRQSLALASEKIAALPESSKLDGQLFVIRHLLILKEMVRSLDLVSYERGMAFSSVTDALASILRNTTSTLSAMATFRNPSAALMGLAGRGVAGFNELMNSGGGSAETMRDAKRELDASLKLICEDLMSQASLMVAAPLGVFLARCRAYLAQTEASSPGSQGDLATQEWATSEEVMKLHDTFLAEAGGTSSTNGGSMEKGLREFLDKLRIFLVDEVEEAGEVPLEGPTGGSDGSKAMNVLVPPTLSEIQEHYTTFYNLVRAEYPFDVSAKLTHPASVGERLRSIAGDAAKVSGNAWTKTREG